MNRQEATIIRKLVKQALEAGFTVSVYDSVYGGGDWTLLRSQKLNQVMDALGTTEGDTLLLRKDGEKFASIALVYGNDPSEVIADYSAKDYDQLDAVAEWLAPITAYAEGFAA